MRLRTLWAVGLIAAALTQRSYLVPQEVHGFLQAPLEPWGASHLLWNRVRQTVWTEERGYTLPAGYWISATRGPDGRYLVREWHLVAPDNK